MGALGPGAFHRPLSEINITPFVDVMLVLLVIFMVTAPMMLQGIDVDLPETTTQPLRVRDEPLVLSVKKDGKYFIGRRELPVGQLEEKLRAIFDGPVNFLDTGRNYGSGRSEQRIGDVIREQPQRLGHGHRLAAVRKHADRDANRPS